jgi:hypothetical protein
MDGWSNLREGNCRKDNNKNITNESRKGRIGTENRRKDGEACNYREQLTSLRLVIGGHLSDLTRESNNNNTSITQTDNDNN